MKKNRSALDDLSDDYEPQAYDVPMYFVTVVRITKNSVRAERDRSIPASKIWCHRCLGYFPSREDALCSIKKNFDFLSENEYYTHVVVEVLKPDFLQHDFKPQWFKLVCSPQSKRVPFGNKHIRIPDRLVKCKTPALYKNVVGLAFG